MINLKTAPLLFLKCKTALLFFFFLIVNLQMVSKLVTNADGRIAYMRERIPQQLEAW